MQHARRFMRGGRVHHLAPTMQSVEVAEEAPPETPEPERAQLLPPTLQDDIVSQALAMGALQFGVPELWRAAHTSRGARLLAG